MHFWLALSTHKFYEGEKCMSIGLFHSKKIVVWVMLKLNALSHGTYGAWARITRASALSIPLPKIGSQDQNNMKSP